MDPVGDYRTLLGSKVVDNYEDGASVCLFVCVHVCICVCVRVYVCACVCYAYCVVCVIVLCVHLFVCVVHNLYAFCMLVLSDEILDKDFIRKFIL